MVRASVPASCSGSSSGTGVGGGIVVVEHKILVGRNDIAGEWGHNPLPWPRTEELPGAPCYCGKSGCIETFLSGRGLAHAYMAATGKTLGAEEIARAASAGEPQASACLDLYADRLARGLTAVINVLDPDRHRARRRALQHRQAL